MSPWKICSRTCIVVLIDSVDKDRVNNALTFCSVHCDNKELHKDVLVCFDGFGLAVAAASNYGGMTRVDKWLQSLAGTLVAAMSLTLMLRMFFPGTYMASLPFRNTSRYLVRSLLK